MVETDFGTFNNPDYPEFNAMVRRRFEEQARQRTPTYWEAEMVAAYHRIQAAKPKKEVAMETRGVWFDEPAVDFRPRSEIRRLFDDLGGKIFSTPKEVHVLDPRCNCKVRADYSIEDTTDLAKHEPTCKYRRESLQEITQETADRVRESLQSEQVQMGPGGTSGGSSTAIRFPTSRTLLVCPTCDVWRLVFDLTKKDHIFCNHWGTMLEGKESATMVLMGQQSGPDPDAESRPVSRMTEYLKANQERNHLRSQQMQALNDEMTTGRRPVSSLLWACPICYDVQEFPSHPQSIVYCRSRGCESLVHQMVPIEGYWETVVRYRGKVIGFLLSELNALVRTYIQNANLRPKATK